MGRVARGLSEIRDETNLRFCVLDGRPLDKRVSKSGQSAGVVSLDYPYRGVVGVQQWNAVLLVVALSVRQYAFYPPCSAFFWRPPLSPGPSLQR